MATLAVLVRTFELKNRPNSALELDFFAGLPSLDKALEHAGLAQDGQGKRYSHQCRLTLQSLTRARDALLSQREGIRGCGSFDALFSLLRGLLSPIPGVGELYVYDTALRLGAFLGLSPDRVYLHTGTREGARTLGLDPGAAFIHVRDFPPEIQRLQPHEIEDFLCIYKGQLRSLDPGTPPQPGKCCRS